MWVWFVAPQNNYNGDIRDHGSQINITNIIMKRSEYFENYQNMTQTWSQQMLLGKGAVDFVQCRIAKNLQFTLKKKKSHCLSSPIKQMLYVIYWHTTFCVSIHILMNIGLFCLLWIKILWMYIYKLLCGHMLLSLFSKYLNVERLGYMVDGHIF